MSESLTPKQVMRAKYLFDRVRDEGWVVSLTMDRIILSPTPETRAKNGLSEEARFFFTTSDGVLGFLTGLNNGILYGLNRQILKGGGPGRTRTPRGL